MGTNKSTKRFDLLLSQLPPTTHRLWTQFLDKRGRPQVKRILITPVESGDGSTSVAVATAGTVARNVQLPLVLIETNFARPGLAKLLGLSPTPGLADVLRGKAKLEDALRETSIDGVWVLPAGERAPDALLNADQIEEVLETVAGKHRAVIFDGAPILDSADSHVLARMADSTVLVARSERTEQEKLLHAAKIVSEVEGKLAGAVLNFYEPSGRMGSLAGVVTFLLGGFLVPKRRRQVRWMLSSVLRERKGLTVTAKGKRREVVEPLEEEKPTPRRPRGRQSGTRSKSGNAENAETPAVSSGVSSGSQQERRPRSGQGRRRLRQQGEKPATRQPPKSSDS